MNNSFRSFFCLILFSSFIDFGFSQTADSAAARRVVLEHADEIRGGTLTELNDSLLTSEPVRILIGNVRLRDSTTSVRCDTAVEYLQSRKVRLASKKNGLATIVRDTVTIQGVQGFYFPSDSRAEMKGSVSLRDNTVTLRSALGTYFTEEQRAVFSENVSLRDSTNTVFTDSLIFFRRENRTIVIGNTRILNTADNVEIRGGFAEHFLKQNRSRITLSPMLLKFDSSKSEANLSIDTLLIVAKEMKSFRGFEDTLKRIEMLDSVKIQRGLLSALAQKAVYLFDSLRISLYESPILWFDASQLTGDSIFVQLEEVSDSLESAKGKIQEEVTTERKVNKSPSRKKTRLKSIAVYGSAFLVSRDTMNTEGNKFNQVSGRNIFLSFNNDSRLSRADVYREAQSLYFTYDDSTAKGANLTSGDEINLFFEDGSATKIVVKGDVEGAQYPERLLARLNNLEGFEWRENERPRLTLPPVTENPVSPKSKSNKRTKPAVKKKSSQVQGPSAKPETINPNIKPTPKPVPKSNRERFEKGIQ
ncbi:MAG: OstA-like protein [Chloroherpetonaceae bacterium]|nr:OstA-like protein [Chloroherpetonaceae bacterium]